MGGLVWGSAIGGVAVLAVLVFAPEWTSFPPSTAQIGSPPTSLIVYGSGQVTEPVPQAPPVIQPVSAELQATLAGGYKNVQVLRDLKPADFMRLQQAITQWVAPKQGCAFCHDTKDYSSDIKPEKIAARRMLEMTRTINATWQGHVAPAGVTCFSCHRGQPVPAETWFQQPPPPERRWVAKEEPYNESADTVRKFFPDAGWNEYLLGDEPIRAQSYTALPSGQVQSAAVVKRIYEMMMQLSDGMGVNCTYCHNSRAFFDWEQSSPARLVAAHAFEQVNQINNEYLLDLAAHIPMTRTRDHETPFAVIPARERGVLNGNGFVVCATCHNAQPKPMNGINVIADWPALAGPAPQQHAGTP